MPLSDKDFESILQANRILSSKLDVEDVLKTIMELATQVVRAEASSILLLDEKHNELYFAVPLGRVGEELKRIRLKVGEGLAGWVAREREPAIVNDVTREPRWSPRADATTGFTTRSILAAPLLLKGRLVGVVEAINKKSTNGFGPDDLRALEVFASQAAVALDNARLFSAIREEKEKLSTVFFAMSDGAILFDVEGRIVLANPSACRFLEWEETEMMGRVLSPEMLTGFVCNPGIEKWFTQESQAGKVELTRKVPKKLNLDGVLHHLAPEAQKDVAGHLLVFRDVTAEKREERVKRAFLNLISHKLRTPLVPILAYADILLEESTGHKELEKKALMSIRTESERLAELINKLLNFTRLEFESIPLNLQPVKTSQVIEQSLSLLESYLKKQGVKPYVDASVAKMPDVLVDPDLMVEVFRNLVENAVKFNTKSQKSVAISAAKRDGFVCLQVADDGPGIPPEEQERIFEKFHQVESFFTGEVPGVGLGLALCKKIVESQGGKILLKSQRGKGCVFSVFLPAYQEARVSAGG